MLPWQFFSTSLSEASQSLVGNANLISKVYFPRLIIPAGAVITSMVDFFISFVLLGVLMLWYGFMPDWRILTLPAFTIIAFLAALGPGLYLTALNVKYRDFRYVIPFIVQFGLFISPVGFSSDVIPEKWRLLYALNPMVGVIDGFRWAICRGQAPFNLPTFALSMRRHRLLPLARHLVFPPHGKDVCGRHLSAGSCSRKFKLKTWRTAPLRIWRSGSARKRSRLMSVCASGAAMISDFAIKSPAAPSLFPRISRRVPSGIASRSFGSSLVTPKDQPESFGRRL